MVLAWAWPGPAQSQGGWLLGLCEPGPGDLGQPRDHPWSALKSPKPMGFLNLKAPACNQAFLISICQRFVKENALHQLQPVIKPLSKGFVKESALCQLQPVIKLFFKVC